MKPISLTALVGILAINPAFGNEVHPYFDLVEAEVEEIQLSSKDYATLIQKNAIANIQDSASSSSAPDALDEFDVKLDKVIAIGKKVWKIIEANKPVVNLSTNRISVVPEGIIKWNQLEGWQAPTYTKYRVTYKNLWGMKVIRIEYVLSYSYGGSFDGKGNYLSQVGYTITDLHVGWGFTVNAYSEVIRVENMGTTANPLASLEMALHWDIDTVFQSIKRANGYMLMGTGEMESY